MTCTKCGISSGGMNIHVRWSCRAEALRVQLLIPLWPAEVYTLPDYMSGLVSPAKQAAGEGCLRWHPILFPARYQLDRVLLSTR